MEDLEKAAIERLKFGSETSLSYYGKPLLLTYSGGKDSDVCIELAKRAGIPYEVVHSHTTADAPETVRHVRQKFRRLELEGIHCNIVYPTYKGERVSMWSLIPKELMPPTRTVRYCCDVLKETAGRGRAIITGVRRAESASRSSRGALETIAAKKSDRVIFDLTPDNQERMYFDDNDSKRRWFEQCKMQGKISVNPIIDWSDQDVWGYLRECHTEINPLYYCGFSRVGCVGCPMAGRRYRYQEFERYPKYRDMYLQAFARMLEARVRAGKPTKWSTASDVFDWWMEDTNIDGQLKFEEEQTC